MSFAVKVCGITRPGDARLVSRLGANMVGLIFHRKSPRYITLKEANVIVAELPPLVRRVGVFVDEEPQRIIEIARRLRLHYIQLHGHEDSKCIRILQEAGLQVIRAFGIANLEDIGPARKTRADLVLLDNRQGEKSGGTGKAFDWKLVKKIRKEKLVLAGGINTDNVEKAVREVDPIVIDVNSGVESDPGIKSARKVKEFLKLCNKIRYGN